MVQYVGGPTRCFLSGVVLQYFLVNLEFRFSPSIEARGPLPIHRYFKIFAFGIEFTNGPFSKHRRCPGCGGSAMISIPNLDVTNSPAFVHVDVHVQGTPPRPIFPVFLSNFALGNNVMVIVLAGKAHCFYNIIALQSVQHRCGVVVAVLLLTKKPLA